MDRSIAVVLLMDDRYADKPLYASPPSVRFEETTSGVLKLVGKSAVLIPWHRIYSVEYVRTV